jgi:soluble lytic murein transglycosylase-like protein
MDARTVLYLAGGGALLWWLSRDESVQSVVESGVDTVQAAVSGWASVNEGPVWVPVINTAENQYGIPANLLARMAYQESRFRPSVIDGTQVGAAGDLGILQMLPLYFSTVTVPRPFTPADTAAQIQQAAGELARLYNVFHDWGLVVAAYNDGQGNVRAYLAGNRALPASTVAYVSGVLADVPVSGATLPA